jgi:hypothetical protein
VTILQSENKFFEREVNKIKGLLDQMTDLCENNSILDKSILIKLDEYLEKHQNYLANNVNMN